MNRRSFTIAASTRSVLPGAFSVGRASRLRQKRSPRLFPPESGQQIRRQPPRVTALMHGEGTDSDGIIRAPGVAQDHAKGSPTACRMPPNHQSAPFNSRARDCLRAQPPPRPRGRGARGGSRICSPFGSAWHLRRLHFVWHPDPGASRPQGRLPVEGLLNRLAHAAKPPVRAVRPLLARPGRPVAQQVFETQL